MKIRNLLWLIAMIIAMISCQTAEEKAYILEIGAWQDTLNMEFKDSAESPLTEADFKTFQNLDFYKIDSKYKVMANFVKTPDELPFGMKTTTDRLPVYVKYGEAYFYLDGEQCRLNVYQNQELIKQKKYRYYLFIPFLDLTSGKESYGGGKYIDLQIPKGDSLLIDFNKSYNPYCAYNHRYSCPIPPHENTLNVEVRAGVKAFGKEH